VIEFVVLIAVAVVAYYVGRVVEEHRSKKPPDWRDDGD